MSVLIQNQFALILGSFLAGVLGWLMIVRRPAKSRAWKLADFVWVGLGGFGAVVALVAGVYRADTSRVARQIDLSYAAMREFDRDAARFRLRYCEGGKVTAVGVLCDKVEFLSASTAINRELPIFLEVTRRATPLQNLRLFAPRPAPHDQDMGFDTMMEKANAFDPEVLTFNAFDESTMVANAVLRQSPEHVAVAADFQVLAATYDELIGQVGALKDEWSYLRNHAQFLALQVLALCLVAFAAPFRLGKSLAELR